MPSFFCVAGDWKLFETGGGLGFFLKPKVFLGGGGGELGGIWACLGCVGGEGIFEATSLGYGACLLTTFP